ncbi:IS3 family transposase [Bacillus sp. JCM 19041]|uniref:IS3 family transposase n=1 Tax=Bacillus sp. JCM 19041 TaxID=1460637 RepID=UPI0006D10012
MLKCEKYYLHMYQMFDELEKAIDDYIYFYNYEWLQKRLNGFTPMEKGIKPIRSFLLFPLPT